MSYLNFCYVWLLRKRAIWTFVLFGCWENVKEGEEKNELDCWENAGKL